MGAAYRFRHHQRLPPTHMESILEQELHVCKANVCCVGYKMYLGSTRLFRLGQRLNQASCGCFALLLLKSSGYHVLNVTALLIMLLYCDVLYVYTFC